MDYTAKLPPSCCQRVFLDSAHTNKDDHRKREYTQQNTQQQK